MTTARTPAPWPAIATAAAGVAILVTGAIWPWFEGVPDTIGTLPAPWLLWATVAAALAVLVALLAGARWSLLLVAVVIVAAFATRASADPGWMCWDGFDDDGNMIGGCEEDRWTPAPILFAVGVALTGAAAVIGWAAARRRRASVAP